MTKKLFVVLASVLTFSFQASASQIVPEPCEQQRIKIETLEQDRENMESEIRYLREEIEDLNRTLANIRSQVGSGEPAPTAYGSHKVE